MDIQENLIVPIDRTHGVGLPCVWEEGGGKRTTGEALLIGDGAGRPKVPYTTKREVLTYNGKHALISIDPGDIVVKVFWNRPTFEVIVARASMLDTQAGVTGKPVEVVTCRVIHHYNGHCWDIPLPAHLNNIVYKAKTKASTYHAKQAIFYKEKAAIDCLEESDVLDDDGLPL